MRALLFSIISTLITTLAMAETLFIPASVREISAFAYIDRTDITEVAFEPGSQLQEIGEYAFMGCTGLKEFVVPEGVSVIRAGTFRECSALRSVTLPSTLLDIKQFAFIYCDSLQNINLPSSLLHIGNNAFSRCTSLESVYVPDTATEIESYAFSDCFALREARLPANPSLLGELLFSGCHSLTLLTEPSPTPPAFDCSSFIFEPTDTTAYRRCRLEVPAASLPLYHSAPGWSLFFPPTE